MPETAMPAPGMQPPELPHDIYESLLWTRPTWHYVAAGVVALALLALLTKAILAWRRRQPKQPAVKVDPWTVLVTRVADAVPPMEFPVGRTQEDYYYGLSLLLREAIEKRTKIPATDLTMQELREPLRGELPLTPDETQAVLSFLERADLVKFAGSASTRDEALSYQGRAVQWVKSLTPSMIDTNPWERDAAASGEARP